MKCPESQNKIAKKNYLWMEPLSIEVCEYPDILYKWEELKLKANYQYYHQKRIKHYSERIGCNLPLNLSAKGKELFSI